jgi:hydroxyacylglutathione hydrolase
LLKILSQNKLDLKAIFITHHHFDHTGGIKEILSKKSIDVYGPKNKIDSINIRVVNESKISLLGIEFEVIEIPGHTLDHIAYYSENNGEPILFCGDTLFAGGCGRVFEGTFEQMHNSLSILKKLPLNTKVYCGHEYTQSNLEFAKNIEPLNQTLISRYNDVLELRKQGLPTLPSTIALEKETNPFLRVEIKELQKIISKKFNTPKNDKDIFTAMRKWKDNF